ncbi:MAG: hypothetical protein AAFO76_14885, partial [Cyanobacteria bacterium J06607_15]
TTAVTTSVVGKAIAFERHKILKLFLGLHMAGVVAGTALSAINQGDLTKGAGIGFGISSINFGVSLVLRLK